MEKDERKTRVVKLTHETVRLVDDSELLQVLGSGDTGGSNYCSSCTGGTKFTCCGTDGGGGGGPRPV
jgi:hypothetical protein